MPNCPICNINFSKSSGQRKYCSPKCRRVRDDRAYRSKPDKLENLNKYYNERQKTFEGYLDRLVGRARKNTIDTDVDRQFLKDLLESTNYKCPISGLSYSCTNNYNCFINPLAPSLDQINPGKGYYKNNVQLISVVMNRAKNDMPNEDFIQMMEQILENLK